jgi:hypothetical protein
MSLASRCRFRTTTRCTWDPLGDRVFSAWLPVCYLDEQDGVLLSDVGARENRAIDAAFEPFLVRSTSRALRPAASTRSTVPRSRRRADELVVADVGVERHGEIGLEAAFVVGGERREEEGLSGA